MPMQSGYSSSDALTVYMKMLVQIYYNGACEVNKRTGAVTKINKGPAFLDFEAPEVFNNRALYPQIAAAEATWQVLGTRDPALMTERAPKLWSKFINQETQQIDNAYGYRWRVHFGRDQLGLAVNTLANDPTSRQVYVSTWDPRIDGLGEKALNVPCPVGFVLNIIDNELNMSVFMRSSDLILGLPYDLMCYWLTFDMIAQELRCCGRKDLQDLKLGGVSFALAHAHYYEVHQHVVEHMLFKAKFTEAGRGQLLKLPGWHLSKVFNDPTGYLSYCDELWRESWVVADYKPKLEVVA